MCEGKFLESIGHCTTWGVRGLLQMFLEGGWMFPNKQSVREGGI